jgi:hypothetical protein
MTSGLGIAAVSGVLRTLFENAIPKANLIGVLGNIDVSALPPDRINTSAEGSRLNLFMYQVMPNPGWCNTDLPSHDGNGRRLTNPPLAMDLHYMLSAYGASDFHGEILLGYGALLVHRTRILTRDAIRAAFVGTGGQVPPVLQLLSTAGLDGQEELIKLAMLPLSVDDISRLWMVFGEKYRPSIAFTASVLLMRGSDATSTGLPVTRARIATTTAIHPTIDRVEPQMVTAGSGATLDLVGSDLLTPDTAALFGSGESVLPDPASTPLRLRVTLPATLRAGLNTARVSQPARFESDLRAGPESNAAPFVLRPAFALKAATTDPDIDVQNLTKTGSSASAKVTVRLVPPVGRRQSVALLLTQPGGPHSYSVPAPSRDADPDETTDTIAFAVEGVAQADYLVRVQVDGAQTVLASTLEGSFTGPSVSLQ